MASSTHSNEPLKSSTPKIARTWFLFFGILSLIIGTFAMGYPQLVTWALVQVLGMLCIISGVFSVGSVTFQSGNEHSISAALLGLVRILAGLGLLIWVQNGVLATTLLLAIFFFLEGILFLSSAFRLRPAQGWWMLLLNGMVALILSFMIHHHFPSDAEWILGLLYGINSIFYGISLISLAIGARGSRNAGHGTQK